MKKIAPFFLGIAILAIWEISCIKTAIPSYILPKPTSIISIAIGKANIIGPHALTTALEIVSGITLALSLAIPLSIAMFMSSSIEKAVAPFLVASQAIPVFALAPLLVVWFGYGLQSKVIMASIIIFFPITVNLLEGFRSCPQAYRDLFRLMGFSRWRSMIRLYWPWALPYFFAGLKVAVSVATIGAVIGEWVGSQSGLGYLMIQSNARLRTELVFASILWLTLMGLFMWNAVAVLEKKSTKWASTKIR